MSSSQSCPPDCNKLPQDLLYEVLLRLPVKSLLRFKAVSKPWYCMISSPDFADSHCTRPRSCAETKLIVHDRYCYDWFSLLQLGHSPLIADALHFPFSEDCNASAESSIVGSDRGIVCVTIRDKSVCQRWVFDSACLGMCSSAYLWNPATKHYKLIPPRNCDFHSRIFGLGFGFDPVNNDFKVMRVVSCPLKSEVYSANLNAWGKVVPKPENIKYPCDFKGCINGILCWIELYHILTFDLSKEVFTCVTRPPSESGHPFFVKREPTHTHITGFNDFIVLITGKGYNGKINLWKPDDVECLRCGGVVEAYWTLMLSIGADWPVFTTHSFFDSGDIIMTLRDGYWFSYNSVKKEAKRVSATFCWGEIFKYTESLVSVPGFEQLK